MLLVKIIELKIIDCVIYTNMTILFNDYIFIIIKCKYLVHVSSSMNRILCLHCMLCIQHDAEIFSIQWYTVYTLISKLNISSELIFCMDVTVHSC